jgi:hypothetical protein
MLSGSHVVVEGAIMQTLEVVRSGPPVSFRASPLVPKIELKVSIPPAISETVPGEAIGGGGAATVGVIVALTT